MERMTKTTLREAAAIIDRLAQQAAKSDTFTAHPSEIAALRGAAETLRLVAQPSHKSRL
jgi:hypothetical protein